MFIVDSIPQPISLIFNSSLQALSLPSLIQLYVVGMQQSESSFIEALKLIPPITKYLILESSNINRGLLIDISLTPSESPYEIDEETFSRIQLEFLTILSGI